MKLTRVNNLLNNILNITYNHHEIRRVVFITIEKESYHDGRMKNVANRRQCKNTRILIKTAILILSEGDSFPISSHRNRRTSHRLDR